MTPLRTLEADKGTTRKTLWRLFDGALVESVLMRYPDRVTMCVSSQAGCGMACPFCATGQGGLQRNMSAAEIVEQVVAGARSLARGEVPGGPGRVSNVVFMGMGEPMANYKAVIGAVRRLTDTAPDGLGMSARGITRVDRRPGAADATSSPTRASRSRWRCRCTPPTTSCATSWSRSTPAGRCTRPSRRPGTTRGRTKRRVSIEYAMMRDINDQAWRADLLGDVLHVVRRLGLGARQPDPAQPDAGLEVDRVAARGRARVRPPARGQGRADHRARHPGQRDRRRLRPARRHRRLTRPARDLRSRRLDRVQTCVRADSTGFKRAFAPTRPGSGVRSRRLGGQRGTPRCRSRLAANRSPVRCIIELHHPGDGRPGGLGQRQVDVQGQADPQPGAAVDLGQLVPPVGAGRARRGPAGGAWVYSMRSGASKVIRSVKHGASRCRGR